MVSLTLLHLRRKVYVPFSFKNISFDLRDYNYIIFPVLCLSVYSSCTPFLIFQIYGLVFSLFVVFTHTHTHHFFLFQQKLLCTNLKKYIHTHLPKYINITCSVCILLPVCMFSEMTNWCFFFTGEDYFPHSQQSLLTCSSLSKVKPHFYGSMSIGVMLVQLMFR